MQKGKEAEEKKEQQERKEKEKETRESGMEVEKFRDWMDDDEMYLEGNFHYFRFTMSKETNKSKLQELPKQRNRGKVRTTQMMKSPCS